MVSSFFMEAGYMSFNTAIGDYTRNVLSLSDQTFATGICHLNFSGPLVSLILLNLFCWMLHLGGGCLPYQNYYKERKFTKIQTHNYNTTIIKIMNEWHWGISMLNDCNHVSAVSAFLLLPLRTTTICNYSHHLIITFVIRFQEWCWSEWPCWQPVSCTFCSADSAHSVPLYYTPQPCYFLEALH